MSSRWGVAQAATFKECFMACTGDSAGGGQQALTASVLFFGRNGCSGTESVLSCLMKCGFRVTHVLSKARGEKLPKEIDDWNGDYIFCFRSLYVLPKRIIEKARIAAVNFHPGPPEYPGSGCINFALYDGCDSYGVTAHLMNEKVDNGPILECRRFPIRDADNLASLLDRTHEELTKLSLDFIRGVDGRGADFVKEKQVDFESINWQGEARRIAELDKLQEVDPNISAAELERVIRATYIEGHPPRINLHGYEFQLRSDKRRSD